MWRVSRAGGLGIQLARGDRQAKAILGWGKRTGGKRDSAREIHRLLKSRTTVSPRGAGTTSSPGAVVVRPRWCRHERPATAIRPTRPRLAVCTFFLFLGSSTT